jgi:hypothetical protein
VRSLLFGQPVPPRKRAALTRAKSGLEEEAAVVARFEPNVDPNTPAVRQAVEKLLAEPAP